MLPDNVKQMGLCNVTVPEPAIRILIFSHLWNWDIVFLIRSAPFIYSRIKSIGQCIIQQMIIGMAGGCLKKSFYIKFVTYTFKFLIRNENS